MRGGEGGSSYLDHRTLLVLGVCFASTRCRGLPTCADPWEGKKRKFMLVVAVVAINAAIRCTCSWRSWGSRTPVPHTTPIGVCSSQYWNIFLAFSDLLGITSFGELSTQSKLCVFHTTSVDLDPLPKFQHSPGGASLGITFQNASTIGRR